MKYFFNKKNYSHSLFAGLYKQKKRETSRFFI